LRGAHTLYNSYWVRFAHRGVDHDLAVANSRTLFEAAAAAGVERIVHISITHPSLDSPYPYFRGKARVEKLLAESGIPHAIARPAILFGGAGVLINNIAWLLRHVPVFAIGGRGDYRVRGIHVDDLARLCVQLGTRDDTVTVDAVGPESLTFRELVTAVRSAVGSHALVVSVPGPVLIAASRVLGLVLRDTLLSSEEYYSMAAGLADSDAPAAGETVLTEWIAEHAAELGRSYANELDRHFRAPHRD
jgi:NADH dehydrogenase